ncbi:hypothetical protein TSUD_346220 [Trifolium subterraneum]|nr:hypothetical protein TSUD_346220 [Trifolium subterraneum]
MERVYSLAEISEQQYLSTSRMNRSDSEWMFQQFLEQADEEETNNTLNAKPSTSSSTSNSSSTVDVKLNINSIDFLRTELDLACARVAKSRESLVNPKDPDNGSQASHPPLPALKESGPYGNDRSKLKVAAGVPSMQKKFAVTIRSTTSGLTDDEEAEGEINMNGYMDPSDAKKVRR